jgi:isoleucyl-tRNA synthetase
MAHKDGDDVRNVLFNDMNKAFTEYALDDAVMAKWDRIIEIRTAVNGALEAARAEKKIGKSLEAKVALTVSAEDAFLAELDAQFVADMFIVSQVEVTVGGELNVDVAAAEGAKCPRCWKFSTTPGTDDLCPRCAAVVAKIPQF